MPTPKNQQDCPPNTLFRKGYTRRAGASVLRTGYTVLRSGKRYTVRPSSKDVHVPAACVKQRSKNALIHVNASNLRKGELLDYGYQWRRKDTLRKKALKKAILTHRHGAPYIYEKLDKAVTHMKRMKSRTREDEEAFKAFLKDRDWVRSHYTV
jgi:hypothetical protein